MARFFFEKIIDEQKIFTSDEILELSFTEEFIDEMFISCEIQNIFLARIGIIPNFARCTKCLDNPCMRYVKKNQK